MQQKRKRLEGGGDQKWGGDNRRIELFRLFISLSSGHKQAERGELSLWNDDLY